MGGLLSSFWGYAGDDELDPASGLTGKQKRLVTETWNILKQDPLKIGMTLMIRLFTKHPDYQSMFHAFKDVPIKDLPENKRFQVHSTAIVNGMSSCIDALKDPGLLEATLLTLGEKHQRRGQTKEHFNSLKSVILTTFSDTLGSRWTTEVKNAWESTLETAFSIIFRVYA